MTSQIDITKPVAGTPTTQSVRDNFATAANEISALQTNTAGGPFLALRGGRMSGVMYLNNDPTDAMMPATKGYVDAAAPGGGGGIPEAPADGTTYGRNNGGWTNVLRLTGGTLTGPLIQAADPVNPLGTVTKQYADAIQASIVPPAPNDTFAYGRQTGAWAKVLPLVGGDISGKLGVGGSASPADMANGWINCVGVVNNNGGAHGFNAYWTTGVAWKVWTTGYSGSFNYSPSTGILGFYLSSASQAAGVAPTWIMPLQMTPKGQMIGTGMAGVPTDTTYATWSAQHFNLAQGGVLGWNAYLSGASWKALAGGFGGYLYMDAAAGFMQGQLFPNTGGGGALTGGVAWNLSQAGVFSAPILQSINGRILSQNNANNPSVSCYNTGAATNFGIWNYGTGLAIGALDGNGVPGVNYGTIASSGWTPTSRIFATQGIAIFPNNSWEWTFYIDGSGNHVQNHRANDYDMYVSSTGTRNWVSAAGGTMSFSGAGVLTTTGSMTSGSHVTATYDVVAQRASYASAVGGFWLGAQGTTGFGLYSGSGYNYVAMAGGWNWMWRVSDGYLMWMANSNNNWSIRYTPDNLAWNPTGATGGNGAYQNISDRRMKENIEPTTVGLPEVLQLQPVQFTRIPPVTAKGATMPDGSPVPPWRMRTEIGFLAQDVAPVLPQAVVVVGQELPDGTGGLKDANPTLGITSETILAAVVNAMKTIDTRLTALEGTA
jgi:Chaperone of endosialidase